MVHKAITGASTDMMFNLNCGKTKSSGNMCAELATEMLQSSQLDCSDFINTLYEMFLELLQLGSRS